MKYKWGKNLMGFSLHTEELDSILQALHGDYDIYAPTMFNGEGIYSDTDMIRYNKITTIEEVIFDQKSNFSFKEVVLPIMQTLFYFTENQVEEAEESNKGAIILLRSCDLHAIKRLDDIYLHNGAQDYYYRRVRDKIKWVVMGCQTSFENCFCVSMKTNSIDTYGFSIDKKGERYLVDCQDTSLLSVFRKHVKEEVTVVPEHVVENDVAVTIPNNLSAKVAFASMWDSYDTRCIGCGRCNFVCPTCTCYTMQDIFYQDNSNVGERRRVWASCMVDGYTEMAGGHTCRDKMGERMRFKVLHKVLDHKKRFKHQMCVGCGRCDDVCPEYISFSTAINSLEEAMEEVTKHEK